MCKGASGASEIVKASSISSASHHRHGPFSMALGLIFPKLASSRSWPAIPAYRVMFPDFLDCVVVVLVVQNIHLQLQAGQRKKKGKKKKKSWQSWQGRQAGRLKSPERTRQRQR